MLSREICFANPRSAIDGVSASFVADPKNEPFPPGATSGAVRQDR
jgi:hypothetical protein